VDVSLSLNVLVVSWTQPEELFPVLLFSITHITFLHSRHL
jgi:hypothetical protein